MKEKPLSPKLIRFCCNIIKGMTGKASAIEAGWTAKSAEARASQLLRNGKVQQFISSKMLKDESVISANEILSGLKRNATFNQNLKRGKMLDAQASNKAYELLGKHQKLWTDKSEITGKDGGAIQVTSVNYADKPNDPA